MLPEVIIIEYWLYLVYVLFTTRMCLSMIFFSIITNIVLLLFINDTYHYSNTYYFRTHMNTISLPINIFIIHTIHTIIINQIVYFNNYIHGF